MSPVCTYWDHQRDPMIVFVKDESHSAPLFDFRETSVSCWKCRLSLVDLTALCLFSFAHGEVE